MATGWGEAFNFITKALYDNRNTERYRNTTEETMSNDLKELEDILRDFLVGATLNDGVVQGVKFNTINDGAITLDICTIPNHWSRGMDSYHWHHLFVPETNVQMLRDRLSSVPSVLSSPVIAEGAQ